MNSQINNPADFIEVVQAYFDKKLELSLPELRSLHHLIDVELRNFKYDSELEKNLKFTKARVKIRIVYLEKMSGITVTMRQKRRSLPQLSVKDLLEKIAA
ncbi:MAG: hypothetical protein UZ19_OD1000751 [Parcubacteria bacterium OLB19]|nr:MAG: hypothetical protein UZ19_OD1000751 [Parcubacteria bacterium OLB19]